MLAQLTQEKLGRGSGKNAGEWTGRVEINKEEIPGSKRSMHGNTMTYSRLERENLYRELVGPCLLYTSDAADE